MKRGVFSVLVENKSGVLSKTAGLFARRGFNIDSLSVGETDDHSISNMTIVSTGDQRTMEQIEKQLNKKIDIIKVRRLEESVCIEREVLLIKINFTKSNRKEIVQVCEIMGAQIVHMSSQTLIIEYFSTPERIDELINHLRSFGIIELVRTGMLALQKELD